jgi:ketosteroid isomerase-like protein
MSRATPFSGGRGSAVTGRPSAGRNSGTIPDEQDLRMTDLQVRIYGDVAVAMGEARAVDGAGDDDARYHVTRVYALRHGRWRRVAGDTTRLWRREER